MAHIWSIYKESRLFKSIKKSTARTYQYTFDILSKLKSGKSGRSFKDVPLDSFDYDSAYNLYEKFVICFKKTQAMYCIPIPPHLVEEVLSKKGYIIADRFGKFDVQRFSRYFKKIRDILGFDERYIFKNMRHTGSTAYVEAGVATNAIISITGHTNEAIFNQVYKGNTEEVTLPALKKRLEAESRNNKIKESE